MLTLNRRGVIGFMLTMAVGVALGAAALVVSNEMTRDKEEKKLVAPLTTGFHSSADVEKAFTRYQKAYKDYQNAVGMGRADVDRFTAAFIDARKKLELELLKNTPGVSEMDLSGITEPSQPESVPQNNVMNFSDSASPFGEGQVVLTTDNNVANAGQAVSGSNNSGGPAVADSSYVSQQTGAANSESAASGQSSGDAAAADFSESQISGMEYYRVRPGDSLYKICQRYYGNGGMWQHILKYQMPNIAATPNLIFPGQLIALPRGLTRQQTADSQSRPTASGIDNANNSAGAFETAPAGDESWQERFQRNYLISDRSLTNAGSMSVAQIQSFLERKKSVLAKDYRGSKPAKMIYDAARKYGINPQVLLARLQCEQGLISKSSATEHKLDWALGVGCYDSGNWNQRFKGLDKQIEYAAHTYRRHYDDAQRRIRNGETISMNIDGQRISVKNAASYAFYKYCPHFQGNKLFYDVWRGYRSSF